MRYIRLNSLVLSTRQYQESDKLITLYSKEKGRVSGIAKGALRSKRRFVNKLEEFSHLHVICRPGRVGGLLFVEKAELQASFLTLRQNYTCFVAGTYLNELILQFTREGDSDPHMFTLLLWAYTALEHGYPPATITLLAHLRLLSLSGYHVQFQHCGSCQASLSRQRNFFLLPGTGVLVCESCARKNGQVHGEWQKERGLSIQLLKLLIHGQQQSLDTLHRLQIPPAISQKALLLLHRYTLNIIQRDIHSWSAVKATMLRPPLNLRQCTQPQPTCAEPPSQLRTSNQLQ